MLVAFAIVIIVTGVAILFSIYSIFTPFLQSFGDIINYNIAYYGAVSAVERGQLVLKNRGPGFEGSGGWLDNNVFGKASDLVTTGFNVFFDDKNGILWSIYSKTNRIPNIGLGNIDMDLSTGDSSNYNKLDYKLAEVFLLYLDETNNADVYAITGSYREEYGGDYISGHFRLPPKIKSLFGSGLCSNCDVDGSFLYDDIVVHWMLNGNYSGVEFSLFPNQSEFSAANPNEKIINYDQDTMIRESQVNSVSGVIFENSKNIFNISSALPETQNAVGIYSSYISGKTFEEIFTDSSITGLKLTFSLANFLISFNDNLYPFLEYFFEFDQHVSDRFYTIQGNGRKGDYDIKIIIKKPTFKQTVAGSFTVIF